MKTLVTLALVGTMIGCTSTNEVRTASYETRETCVVYQSDVKCFEERVRVASK